MVAERESRLSWKTGDWRRGGSFRRETVRVSKDVTRLTTLPLYMFNCPAASQLKSEERALFDQSS